MDDAANQVEAIFTEALGQPGRARQTAFVVDACGANARLRARVEALLKAHHNAGTFMAASDDASAVEALDAAPFQWSSGPAYEDSAAERPGSVIGRYKLLERVGEHRR